MPTEMHVTGHKRDAKATGYIVMTLRACSFKGRIVILGRIVSASGQIFRSDFRPQDEIFRPGMPFRPLDEHALKGHCDRHCETHHLSPLIFNSLHPPCLSRWVGTTHKSSYLQVSNCLAGRGRRRVNIT